MVLEAAPAVQVPRARQGQLDLQVSPEHQGLAVGQASAASLVLPVIPPCLASPEFPDFQGCPDIPGMERPASAVRQVLPAFLEFLDFPG